MGFLSKNTLIKAYKVLSTNTDSPSSQGATQKVSALRYLFALDRFYKLNNKDCDTKTSDKNQYVNFVGEIVKLSDNSYTSNFYRDLYTETDFKVGSNFFSVNAVKDSIVNPAVVVDFPRREKNAALIKIQNGILLHNTSLYSHINKYLSNSEIKIAFALWLIREVEISDAQYNSIKTVLFDRYSEELIETLLPEEKHYVEYNEKNGSIELSEYKANINKEDILNLFQTSGTNDKNIQTKSNISNENQSLLSALRTKPFVLLAGISGTGKSRIVRELAFKSCPKELQDADHTTPGNYCMIEVKPNWHDSTELLGYYSNISKQYQFTKFVRFAVKAMMYPNVPFFVCLDEMNLAPVEQYFAEFLSVLETRSRLDNSRVETGVLVDKQYFEGLAKVVGYQNLKNNKEIYQKLWETTDSEEIDQSVAGSDSLLKKGLTLPDNLFVIGTVNMDDTTHSFSRKVIDRAMTIEMNGGDFSTMFGGSANLDYLPEDKMLKLEAFQPKYINADEVLNTHSECIEDIKTKSVEKIKSINNLLENTPFVVSYRVLNELVIYIGNLLDDKGYSEDSFDDLVQEAFDAVTLMKILPRVEGDDEMFSLKDTRENRLQKILELFPNTESGSHKKLEEMNNRLEQMQFTRFWP